MAKRRMDSEPNWPPEFAEFDPHAWESHWEWKVARIRWARDRGFKQYKILPSIQALAAAATGVEADKADEVGDE
jgi:hypothetical protein